MIWQIALYLLCSYLMGAVPTAYIIAKQFKGIDIREHGSGNVGATNVGRVVGKKAGFATLILDFLKGVIPVASARYLFPVEVDPYGLVAIFAGLLAIVGHSKSVFIGFKGGKSAITSLGVVLGLVPLAALSIGAVAYITVKLTRYVSLGSILAALSCPVFVWLYGGTISQVIFTFLAGLYVVFLHRSNIQRLIHHQENRI